ncbi:hypothetical protein KI614_11525 [Dechloromonas denitrificans]|uniref:FimV/HubP family polar landmark protein n=1 Tax=Dechloromonas denitrificans TaxID=281362 RepID=UPI001CF8ED06|nr:FimV/HubP family polar landmark protein [Dechloromonas denitrificans]UCV10804.1 hypothetical protein KI614_11525 [Dechloromonas denitrificans]
MTVLSGLGQPLRAELEVAANREELVGMTARLAPQSAFRQAGVDYSSVLNDLRFNVEKRPDGKSVVKVTSEKPINEPFLDFLMELNWPAGRLVREYTFLLDPPEIAAKQVARPVAEARVVETVRGGGAQVERTERAERPPEIAERPKVSKPAARPVVEDKPQPVPEKKATEPADGRVVHSGDTLRKIAAETRVEGVSLDQMLVGIFQKNPDAFIGNNMNRLKAGAILGLPEKTELESLSDADVKKVLVAQSGDWNAYRQKLASATAKAPVKEESLGQGSSGKIAAKVDEKALPSEQAKDQVKVSRTEMPVKGSAASKSVLGTEADLIARDRSLKEAQERLAFLEKNVGELQKLLEMKNQKLAELQQQGAVKKEESKPLEPAKVIEPPKPVEPAKPVEPVKVVEPPKEAAEAKPAEPSKPVEVKPAVEAPKPAAVKKPEAVKPPEPEEEPEPGFVETLLADPLPLAGGGGILALLAGYLLFKRRRDHNASVETTAAPVSPSSGGNSVFRMTGGQSVDTSNTPPQTGDFSQAGPGSIDTDEVDPVAEADVYMAYGRDAQAEEILLEALQKDPNRIAIHAKLLEIYANRKSVKQFETLASELYAQTAGVGPEWAKVAAMGVGLDPGNPLYSGVQRQASAFNADATMVVTPEVARQAAQFMPEDTPAEAVPPAIESVDTFERDTLVLPEVEPAEPEAAVVEVADEVMSLDFDLGAPADEMPSAPAENIDLPAPPAVESLADASDALDFDLGASIPAQPALQDDVLRVDDNPVADDLDFELDIAESSAVDDASEPLPDFSPGGTLVMPALGELADSSELSPAVSPVAEAVPEAPLGDFSLDLDAPPAAAAPAESYGTDTVVNTMLLDQAVDIQNPSLTDATADENAVEFDVKLTDSVFLGQPATPEFDIGAINLDLSAEPAESAPAESAVAPAAAAPSDNAQWEEVNTKLDLAKAYEEMGDLEGARELLQEVASEGPVDLVEQAREILARIGG